MKKILSTLLLLITFQFGYAQTLEAKIEEIRSSVQKINKVSGFKVKTLANEEFLGNMTDGGGELKAFYLGGALLKITEKVFLSSCFTTTDYYFKHDNLIFTYTKGEESEYDERSNRFDYRKLNLTMECRLYFENSKLIKAVLNGTYRCGDQSTLQRAKNNLEDVIFYKEKLRSK